MIVPILTLHNTVCWLELGFKQCTVMWLQLITPKSTFFTYNMSGPHARLDPVVIGTRLGGRVVSRK